MRVVSVQLALELLVAFSLVVTSVQGWLVLNKTWPRRAQPEVVQSYSIGAYTLGLFNGLPFLVLYAIRGDILSLIGQAIGVGLYVYFVLFAAGLWLPLGRASSLFALIRSSFMEEARELRNLSSIINGQKDRKHMLEILSHVAAVDTTVATQERLLLARIAESWGITETELPSNHAIDREEHMLAIAKLTDSFLAEKPSIESAHTLVDLVQMMINADFVREPEEQAVLTEVVGRVTKYTSDAAPPPRYEVVFLSSGEQTGDESDAIAFAQTIREFGGMCQSAGAYFDPSLALIVCGRLRSESTVAVVVDREYSNMHRLPTR